eukprot:3113841-Rhodomonas_salina.1
MLKRYRGSLELYEILGICSDAGTEMRAMCVRVVGAAGSWGAACNRKGSAVVRRHRLPAPRCVPRDHRLRKGSIRSESSCHADDDDDFGGGGGDDDDDDGEDDDDEDDEASETMVFEKVAILMMIMM